MARMKDAIAEAVAAADGEYPDRDTLEQLLALYVDVKLDSDSGDADYVGECTDEALEWLDLQVTQNATYATVPPKAYTRAFLEVGAQLFRRRRSWGNTDQLEAPATPPVYADPFKPGYTILAPFLGPVIA